MREGNLELVLEVGIREVLKEFLEVSTEAGYEAQVVWHLSEEIIEVTVPGIDFKDEFTAPLDMHRESLEERLDVSFGKIIRAHVAHQKSKLEVPKSKQNPFG